jgi:small subunit ribosomal protein S5e
LMMKGRNNGKKLMAVRIVAHAFEIIHLLTDQNPIQVCRAKVTAQLKVLINT